MLIPATAKPWLAPATRDRTWPSHGAMMLRRREALTALLAAYGAWPRLGLGALAWALGIGGAVLVGRGMAEEGSAYSAGIGLLVLATALGGVIVATGSALARAVADWWTLATGVRADGARVDAVPDPDTLRAHREAVDADRTEGAGELWRPPLLPRTAAALALTVVAVVLAVQLVAGYAEISTPFAGADVRGPWLTRALIALLCLLTAGLIGSGLRRVHRARMHRVPHQPLDAARRAPAPGETPALGSGAIVVGGQRPTGPPPEWADTFVGTATDEAPAAALPAHPGGTVTGAPGAPATGGTVPDDATAPAPAEPPANPDPPAHVGPAHGGTAPDRAAAPAAAAAPADPRALSVRLGDGRELATGTTLLGRDPRPRPGEQADALLAVSDESVSRTHLTVQLHPGRAVVIDRGSTNGTVVHHPDGREQPLRPHEPQEVGEGAVVVLGVTTLHVGRAVGDLEHTVLRR